MSSATKNGASSEGRAATDKRIRHKREFLKDNMNRDETFAKNYEHDSPSVQGCGADVGCTMPKASLTTKVGEDQLLAAAVAADPFQSARDVRNGLGIEV